MLFSYSLAAVSVASSFVSARPLTHYRRQGVITDFGTCNATPDIIFALGLDGRKDFAFQAKNNDVFNHGSALGVGVITSFICQQLNDKCKAPAATLAACATGQAAAAKAVGGAAADVFNNAFGITTSFASSGAAAGTSASSSSAAASSTSVAAAASSETAAASSSAAGSASTCAVATTVTVTVEPTATADATPCPTDPVTVTVTTGAATSTAAAETSVATSAAETTSIASNVAIASSTTAAAPVATGSASTLDFGSCTNPTIEFGPAFEGRKAAEFSNKPVDKTEFAQGSALNIDIVTRAICDILANKCKAPQATLDACAKGQAAASAAPAKTGAQADGFNGALGFTTDFANIPAAPGGGAGSLALATTPNFGSCTDPTIVFGPGFDGRTENSFQPSNKASFNHGSALNPTIIATAICDTFVNSCNANKPAIDNCAAAKTASTGLTGQAFADAFNTAVLKGSA